MLKLQKIENLPQKLLRSTIIQLLFFYVLTFVAMYIVSSGTSPSNSSLGADTSVFIVMGNALADGFIPYRDFFDHKGPLLYYIYALAQYDISGKLGIFILQTVALSLSLFAAFKVFRLFFSRVCSAILLLPFTFYIISKLSSGGLTGEWSLPVSMLLMYIIINKLSKGEKIEDFSMWLWFLLGAGMGWHSMLRVTNAGCVSGIILLLFIALLYKKCWLKALYAVMASISGLLALTMPIFFHFFLKEALTDLWYGLYQFNAIYATCMPGFNVYGVLTKTMSAIAVIAAGGYIFRKEELSNMIWPLMLCILLASCISLMPGLGFTHYYMNFAPALCCALVVSGLMLKRFNNLKGWILCAVCVFATVLPGYREAFRTMKKGIKHAIQQPAKSSDNTIQKFRKIINAAGSNNKVLVLNTYAHLYCYMGIQPPHKYFFFQAFLGSFDPTIIESVNAYLKGENAPDWLIIPCTFKADQMISIDNTQFEEAVLECYEFEERGITQANGPYYTYALYRRKETK